MSSILKISDAAAIAIHTMVLLASDKNKSFSNKEIALKLNASENHLSKILQRLTKNGLVESIRGPKGGFKISKGPEEITILSIYEAIDGPLEPTNCLMGAPVCNGNCVLGDLLSSINLKVKDYFENKTLKDLLS